MLRHGAEIAVGVNFVPDRRGPVGASAALRRSVVDDDDLGVLVCPPRLDVPGGTVGIERPTPHAVAIRKVEASRARDTGAIEVFASS